MPLTLIYTHKDARIEVDEINSYLQITWLQHPNSKDFRHIVTLAGYYGEVDHVIPWQIDQWFGWQTAAAPAVEAPVKVVI